MIVKALFRYLRARGSEGSTWAGLSVLGLFLNQLTGWNLDPLMGAVADALPMLVTGNWIGVLLVVLPAIVAVLKQDRPDPETPQRPVQAAGVQPGPPQPPGAPGAPYGGLNG